MRALDHAVETIYSARPHPLSDALAERGLSPPAGASSRQSLDERSGAVGPSPAVPDGRVAVGLRHDQRRSRPVARARPPDRTRGGTFHTASPPASRFRMRCGSWRQRRPIASARSPRALASRSRRPTPEAAALECADRMSRFIAQFDLPQRLRDVRVPQEEVREVADLVHDILDSAHVSDRPDESRAGGVGLGGRLLTSHGLRLISRGAGLLIQATPHPTHSGYFPFTLSAN